MCLRVQQEFEWFQNKPIKPKKETTNPPAILLWSTIKFVAFFCLITIRYISCGSHNSKFFASVVLPNEFQSSLLQVKVMSRRKA